MEGERLNIRPLLERVILCIKTKANKSEADELLIQDCRKVLIESYISDFVKVRPRQTITNETEDV